MSQEEGDRAPLIFVAALATALPLILKLVFVYLRFKRRQKKRRKIFRKTFKKAGMEPYMIDQLCEDMQDISLRDLISKKTDIPGIGDFINF